jgi:hypothetical protein
MGLPVYMRFSDEVQMKTRPWMLLVLCLSTFLLAACGHGKSFDAPQTGEIPKGPGLFTKGEDGAVLYDSKGGGMLNPQARPAAETSIKAGNQTPSANDFEEYEAYRQWKAWKESSQGSPDYKDFKDWQEWKRYQEWKRNQP